MDEFNFYVLKFLLQANIVWINSWNIFVQAKFYKMLVNDKMGIEPPFNSAIQADNCWLDVIHTAKLNPRADLNIAIIARQ